MKHKDTDKRPAVGLQYPMTDGSYLIYVAAKGNRGWRNILAHELVHVWVDENYPKAQPHGKTFQRACASLRKALQYWGYELSPFYLKGIDE